MRIHEGEAPERSTRGWFENRRFSSSRKSKIFERPRCALRSPHRPRSACVSRLRRALGPFHPRPRCQFGQPLYLGRENSKHGGDRKGQVARSIPGDGERERSERERRKPSVARLSEQARDRRERAQRAPDGEPSNVVRKSAIFVMTRISDSRTTRRTELSDLGLSLHKPAV